MVKDKAFYRTLLYIALPVALQNLISFSVVLIDNVMVGSLGEVVISAVSLANQVTLFFIMVLRGVSGGAAVLISQYWGKNDIDRIKKVFAMIMQITLVITLLLFSVIYFFPEATMKIFTNNTDVIKAAVPFLRVMSFSYIFFAVSDTLISMLRCVEIVKVTLYISITSLVVDAFFNYLLIFGNLGFPKLGAVGSAWSTVITRIVELIVVIIYMFFVQKKILFKIRDFFRSEKALWVDYFRYSLPILVGDVQWGLVGLLKSPIIGRLGVSMISAYSISNDVMSLGMIFSKGLATGACVLIGKSIGSGDPPEKTKKYSDSLQIIFVIVGVLMASLVFFTRTLPPMLYNITPETKTLLIKFLAVGGVTLLGTCYHAICFTGINRGSGDSRFVFWVDLVFGWLVILPLMYLGAFVWTLPLVYVFLLSRTDQCLKWIVAFIRLRGNKWIRNVTRN